MALSCSSVWIFYLPIYLFEMEAYISQSDLELILEQRLNPEFLVLQLLLSEGFDSSVCHCVQFTWFWGLNPGPRAC